MWVAACALRHNLPPITLNNKDFADFEEHHGLLLLGEDQERREQGGSRPRSGDAGA